MCRCATSGLFSSLTFDLGWVTSFFLIFSPSSLTLLHEVVLGVCDDDCSILFPSSLALLNKVFLGVCDDDFGISALKCYKVVFQNFSLLRRRWPSSTRLFWGYATTIAIRCLNAIRLLSAILGIFRIWQGNYVFLIFQTILSHFSSMTFPLQISR